MFLIPTTRKKGGSRFKKLLYVLPTRPRYASFMVSKHGSKHNYYHHTMFPKKTFAPRLVFGSRTPNWYFYCTHIFSTGIKYKALHKSSTGSYIITPLVSAVTYGSKVSFLRNTLKNFFYVTVGAIARLKFLKLAVLVSNIGYGSPSYATACGVYAKIRLHRKRTVTIILPSGLWVTLTRGASGIIGRNAAPERQKVCGGKASFYNRIMVRSAAKNPVDHPNGGRTRGKKVSKTPWGRIAKSNK